jgi:hypothetical protein
MRRTLVILALVTAAGAIRPAAQTPPKLVVILVVDQMRADYLTRFDRHWRAGFRTLLSQGAVFDNANYPYFTTETCAGHATIGTGTFPHTHGMITNAWWRRDVRRNPECTVDADVAAVTYGAAVTFGSSPAQLMAPTLADEMRARTPGTRVVAISLKSRGAITLAGHAADAIVWFEDAAATWATSKAYAPAPVPAVKRFFDANPMDKEYGRTWSLMAPPETYLQRDAGIGERPLAGWSGLFPHVIPVPAARGGAARGAAPAAPAASAPPAPPPPPGTPAAPAAGNPSALWQATPFADAYVARMAVSLLDSFELGQRETTDFLSISFSTLDDAGHAFGPDSREVEDILRNLDITLGSLIDTLDARVGRANYVLGFSADHGVASFAGLGRGGRVNNEDVRDRVDDVLTARFGALKPGTSYVESMVSGQVYLAPGVFDRLKANAVAMSALQRAMEELPGIARVLRADQLSETSRDPVVRAGALSHFPNRSGDLLIVVQPNWTLQGRATNSATHGSTNTYDTHVPLIFLGGAFKPGHSGAAVTPADMAPTLARAIGLALPKAEGRALAGALR